MNVLFVTQSGAIAPFEALRRKLAERVPMERAGFVVADASAYLDWTAANPEFERAGHLLLKEWEVTARRDEPPDLQRLRRYEEMLGGPGLFGAVVTDRRLLMGPNCTYTQDYRRRFGDAQLLRIIEVGAAEVERLLDTLKPDLVLGFICVTFLEYLVYLFAKARGIRYLNLRPTRIGNTVFFGSTLNDPAPEVAEAYERIRRDGSPRLDEARRHVEVVRAKHGKYEGVVPPSAKPARKVNLRLGRAMTAARLLRDHVRYRRSIAYQDNHAVGVLRPLIFNAIVNPLTARRVDRALRPCYVRPDDLQGRRYAFFPLHTEPEVSLLVYSRPFVNQIEAVRAMAFSLPADMVLLVKEHPWMVGKRSLSAYRKLLNIPRVLLAPPEINARHLIIGAELVVGLTSSVGLEAAMLRTPVVSLGHAPYNLLPETMVRRCADLLMLPQAMRALLEEHVHDEAALEAYVAAVLELGIGVNLYSVLLGRSSVHAEHASDFEQDIAALADYALWRAQASQTLSGTHPAAAPW